MSILRGLCVGAGYFAQYHFDAWRRIDAVQIVGVCDKDRQRAKLAADFLGTAQAFDNVATAIESLAPDFVDIITPPETHLELVEICIDRGMSIICQKPLAPDFATAERIVHVTGRGGARLMVHENFRFQPWHRQLKRLIDSGVVGEQLFSLSARTRLGDGWGDDAYSDRQPYFRRMPRLLIHETGVHFIDIFRYLGGEIDEVTAQLRRLNTVIAGEDAALVTFRFANGAAGLLDANRYNDSTDVDPRLTFGDFLIEGTGGSLRLYGDGRVTVQPLGERERSHPYDWENIGFSGDCVFATQRHFVNCLRSGNPFETNGPDYLQTLRIVEAVYESDRLQRSVAIERPAARPISEQPTMNLEQ